MLNYDYILIGSGAAGLLLANALGSDSFFDNKRILLIDKDDKQKNDRTWCFWEKQKGLFDDILFREWRTIFFSGARIEKQQEITPYQYKMLRGIDFYANFLGRLQSFSNIYFEKDNVKKIEEHEHGIVVYGDKATYECKQLFDSRFNYRMLEGQKKYPVLQQHFLGWFVKTAEPIFDDKTATFMDFSIEQKGNTRFMYVLPFSPTEALVEYTLFSANTLVREAYENAIVHYLKNKLGVADYEITEVEQGNIPMTCFDFSQSNTKRLLKIGIAGGWAKPSTGYMFYNSTKKVKRLVRFLKTEKPLNRFAKKTRFWFYDLLLLDILNKDNSMGRKIFESLFSKRHPQLILKFLDEDTNMFEELFLICACPKRPFINALLNRIFKKSGA